MPPKVAKAEKAVGKKRVKKAKDPDAVKKAPSAYIIFCTERRAEVKAENPNATFGELGKILGRTWAELSEADKEEYKEKQNARKAELDSAGSGKAVLSAYNDEDEDE